MRIAIATACFIALLGIFKRSLRADDYLSKDGRLTKQLKAVELQGGFAGNTGVRYTIETDGSWTSETLFNKKSTPKDKGKLTKNELAKLAAILKTYDLAKLPEKSGTFRGANPHSIELEFGDQQASLVGQTPPKLDSKNPSGTVESRFAGVWEGVAGLLKPAAKN